MNRRNAEYVLPGNPRSHYPRVDDKLITKQFCERHGIPVPKTYGVIRNLSDVRRLPQMVEHARDFVIKPAHGAEGRGIIVVIDHDGIACKTAGGETMGLPELRYHLENVLSGLYSLGGQPDVALVEQRIIRHNAFEKIAVMGTPDIRVILYRCVPVMAMVRLPTRASRGKANLHQGAVAAGIDLLSGRTFGGVCQNRAVALHPDTGNTIAGVEVPNWHDVLMASMKLGDVLEMNYIGVDFVLDATIGPVVLEANARPGLAIQIANRQGLLPRLQFIDSRMRDVLAHDQRLTLIGEMLDAIHTPIPSSPAATADVPIGQP